MSSAASRRTIASRFRSAVDDAEIAIQVAPDGVNMIRRVAGRIRLHVDEFQDEGRPLDAIVVSDPWLRRTGPGKVDAVESGGLDLSQAAFCQGSREVGIVSFEK